MNNLEHLTLAEMEKFVRSHRHLNWSATGQKSVYGLIEGVLKAQKYGHLKKGQKSVVKGFLAKVTALSRAQITRLTEKVPFSQAGENSESGLEPGLPSSFPRFCGLTHPCRKDTLGRFGQAGRYRKLGKWFKIKEAQNVGA